MRPEPLLSAHPRLGREETAGASAVSPKGGVLAVAVDRTMTLVGSFDEIAAKSPTTYDAVTLRYPNAPVRTIAIADQDRPVAARAITVGAHAAARPARRVLATILVLDLSGSSTVANRSAAKP